MKKLIRNAFILQDAATPAKRLDMIVENDKISAIGPHLELTSNNIEQIEDGSNSLIIPGLVNAHLHSHDRFDKGRFGTIPLEIWISLYNPPTISRQWTPRECYLRTMISGIELLRSGTTMVIDDVHHGMPFNNDNIEAVFQAYKDLGIRAQVSVSHSDKPFWEGIPYLNQLLPDSLKKRQDQYQAPTSNEVLDYWEKMALKWNGIVQFVLSPSGPQRCSEMFLQDTWSLSEKHKLPVVIHVLETQIQQMSGDFFYQKSLVEYMNDLELLTPRTNLIHGVWMTNQDLDLIAANNSCIVHCPASTLKLASGIAPLEEMIKRDITVGLGTDNHNANDSANILETMKLAGLLPTINNQDYQNLPCAKDILHMATAGGANCASLGDSIGSLEVGKQADYVVFDLNHSSFSPLNDVANQIVYSEQGEAIKEVVVAGKPVFKDGSATQIDETKIFEELRESVTVIQQKIANTIPTGQALEPYLKEAYLKCMEQISK